ncbi:glycosyltransferase [Thermosipho melanesiensis]|uniref:Glycosyl transferase, group 1 n=2 Tax=Thermosipho melanesiensis TaxID=46541 RepID=A6LJY1_THEM4|nr:glycosyltransferase [Thermosipho melanesiensis]ABR30232.1 glycosyl transferase, group 1 [Thermosipho melanesiensis BI429]APT73422.1 glycosyl transferase family 1 [Thermosipho melanesiensis]
MKLIFVALDLRDHPSSIGPSLKIKQQCNAFEEHGFDVYELMVENRFLYIRRKDHKEKIYSFKKKCLLKQSDNPILRRFKFLLRMSKILDILVDFIKKEDINITYVRNLLPWNPISLRFIKQVKKLKNVLVLDVPTYPYKDELSNINRFVDEMFNRFVGKYVDIIVTPSDEKEIYGVKSLKVTNGIEVNRFKVKNSIKKVERLDLIGVANVSRWHGYDRVIRGIYEYNKNFPKSKVYFHIVGNGKELYNLKKLTVDLKLEDFVKFHGFKVGDKLDRLFDLCDIAIGSLGMHRIGLRKSSVLKVREYCARGIPFVLSSDDEDFENFEFMLKVPANESPIDIDEILNFYKEIKEKDYVKLMRNYAMKNLSWKSKLKRLVDEIKNLM